MIVLSLLIPSSPKLAASEKQVQMLPPPPELALKTCKLAYILASPDGSCLQHPKLLNPCYCTRHGSSIHNGGMLNVILYQPEIPPNTGNIIRLCANTGAKLHLIEPLGFKLDDAKLRRAGLDYHEFADVRVHSTIEACFSLINRERVFAFTRHASSPFNEVSYQEGDAFLFGRETQGLPNELLTSLPVDRRLRLPMCSGQRSLNLSNAVAIAVYEAWRQLGYPGSVPA